MKTNLKTMVATSNDGLFSPMKIRGVFSKFSDFFVQAFKTVVDP